MYSQSGGDGLESLLLYVCIYEEKVHLGTSAMNGVVRDFSKKRGRAVKGEAEIGCWGEDFDTLNFLLEGDRNTVFKVEILTGE